MLMLKCSWALALVLKSVYPIKKPIQTIIKYCLKYDIKKIIKVAVNR